MKKFNFIFILTICMGCGVSQEVTFDALNKAFGIPLFQDDNLWDDDEKEVAKRLGWPQESKTDTLASYRLYATPKDSVLGARPYSLALYAEKGLSQQLSMMFSNKGDIEEAKPRDNARAGSRREEVDPKILKLLDAAIKRDEEVIEQRLKELLGDPRHDAIGVGKQMEQASRWDWNGHAFLLAAPKGEYVSIRILPVEAADNNGKAGRVSDDEVKALLISRVETRGNGDRIIQQIPMVDQGPKGYCVPATIERQLRFLGIPSDLYLLAMKGGTSMGGGTSTYFMIESIKSLCSIYGRSIQTSRTEIHSRILSKYIDQGLPILWCCFVHPVHDKNVSLRSKERESVTDWSEWKKKIEPDRKSLPLKNILGGHMRMIIGYNPSTNEIAISDSWGEEYKERWMTYEEANALSQEELIVIQW